MKLNFASLPLTDCKKIYESYLPSSIQNEFLKAEINLDTNDENYCSFFGKKYEDTISCLSPYSFKKSYLSPKNVKEIQKVLEMDLECYKKEFGDISRIKHKEIKKIIELEKFFRLCSEFNLAIVRCE